MLTAGIDIGSRTTKGVLCNDGTVLDVAVTDTGTDPLGASDSILARFGRVDALCATGYGRHLVAARRPDVFVITEIRAVALGAASLVRGVRSIVDIGGQDTKVVLLDEQGRVTRFTMNDRCAAGTGMFLESMATTLGFRLTEFLEIASNARESARLSSMCTVFAQSEVVSLISRGASPSAVALGAVESVAERCVSQAGGLGLNDPVVFSGGCAKSDFVRKVLSSRLKHELLSVETPQTVAALGCALEAGFRARS